MLLIEHRNSLRYSEKVGECLWCVYVLVAAVGLQDGKGPVGTGPGELVDRGRPGGVRTDTQLVVAA
jgi:hypothetical protein